MIHTVALNKIWGYSSAGRALEWHSRGQRFDPAYLHHKPQTKWPASPEIERFQDFFFFPKWSYQNDTRITLSRAFQKQTQSAASLPTFLSHIVPARLGRSRGTARPPWTWSASLRWACWRFAFRGSIWCRSRRATNIERPVTI